MLWIEIRTDTDPLYIARVESYMRIDLDDSGYPFVIAGEEKHVDRVLKILKAEVAPNEVFEGTKELYDIDTDTK